MIFYYGQFGISRRGCLIARWKVVKLSLGALDIASRRHSDRLRSSKTAIESPEARGFSSNAKRWFHSRVESQDNVHAVIIMTTMLRVNMP